MAISVLPPSRHGVESFATKFALQQDRWNDFSFMTLRRYPLSFLRPDLTRRNMMTCADAVACRDRRWVHVAGLVLVRQRPGSAKGVMFITLEDESAVANLVVWTKIFEKYRRIVLGSGMIGVKGRPHGRTRLHGAYRAMTSSARATYPASDGSPGRALCRRKSACGSA